jgi:hypothetical protein
MDRKREKERGIGESRKRNCPWCGKRGKKVERSLDAPQICVCVCTSKKIWSMALCGNVGEEKDQESLKPGQGVTKGEI